MKSSIRTSASLLAILATFCQSTIAASSSSLSRNSIDSQYSSPLGSSPVNSFKIADKAVIIDNDALTVGAKNRATLLKCSESNPCIEDRIVIDSYKETLSSDGAIKEANIALYNTSFAPAAIEVYSSDGKFKSVDFVDGTKPGFKDFGDLLQTTASGLIEPFTCASKGSVQCWNEFKYGRYGVKKAEKKLKLQTGDVIRISRGSEPARLYADILEKMDIVELMIAGSEMNPSKKTPLTLKNNFSPELRIKIIAGYIKKKMNEKYTWTMLMREFGYAAGKTTLNNPLEFFNNAVEVAKNIPADFWEATTDGTVASRVAGDGLSVLIESASKKASLIVDSALFVSQSVNIYARSTASESAYKKPYPIIVAYANPTKDQTVRVPVKVHKLTINDLDNTTYSIPKLGSGAIANVKLVNGSYQKEDHCVFRQATPISFGDINGDGLEDAVVVLREGTPNNRSAVIIIAVVLNGRKLVSNVDILKVGTDKEDVLSIDIKKKYLKVTMKKDYPTRQMTKTYQFRNNRLSPRK